MSIKSRIKCNLNMKRRCGLQCESRPASKKWTHNAKKIIFAGLASMPYVLDTNIISKIIMPLFLCDTYLIIVLNQHRMNADGENYFSKVSSKIPLFEKKCKILWHARISVPCYSPTTTSAAQSPRLKARWCCPCCRDRRRRRSSCSRRPS